MSRSILGATLALFLVPALATAGPIQWSFSSTGAQTVTPDGVYSFTGWTNPLVSSEPGTAYLSYELLGQYSVPALVSPIPLDGPTLTTRVTITDLASGQSGWLDVPVSFYDNEPAPEGEIDMHIPGLYRFAGGTLDLGGNRYTLGGGPQLSVTAEPAPVATPEPTTLALAGLGLAACGLRFRRRAAAPSVGR
jgi:hypothetical protein